MESLLTGFYTELATIGAEIQTLQEQSEVWSTRHKNRANVQRMLEGVVDGAVVGVELIRLVVWDRTGSTSHDLSHQWFSVSPF